MKKTEVIIYAIVFSLGISYLVWLNWGCYTGIMTWQGKVCLEDLTK